ncbi:hypothetical protein [Massilia sp. TSP1-1-2]|uniref:hypothetical protein n=1 Tax=unclassified Massilia TaxID=2609279 RepID=UPI003CF13B21
MAKPCWKRLCAGLAICLLTARAGAQVGIDVAFATDQAPAPGAEDALLITYRLPPHCASLRFDKTAQERAGWRAQDACGAADARALTRGTTDCDAIRFRVPLSTEKTSGYPAAFSFGAGQAAFTHTSNFALDQRCGPLQYSFKAAHIALGGKLYQAFTPALEGAGDVGVLLLRSGTVLESVPDMPLSYFDPALGDANIAAIRTVAQQTIAYYRRALPDAPFRMPVLAVARPSGAGGPRVEGDASDVVRLVLHNWPRTPDAYTQRLATMFVSHEFSHRFQMRDAVDVYPEARVIHEGGAELLRWLLALEKGWLSPAQAKRELDTALAQCLLAVGAAPWGEVAAAIKSQRRLEYRCGLPLYVYALGSRQGPGTALQRINQFYRELAAGAQPDFARTVECGALAPCSARWLPALLGSQQSMHSAWRDLFSHSKLARPGPLNQAQKDVLVEHAVEGLMVRDCGASSYFLQQDGVIFDQLDSCRHLRGASYLKRIAGLPVFKDPRTWQRLSSICRKRAKLPLAFADGSGALLDCGSVPPQPRWYAADIEAVRARLLAPR